MVDNPVVPIRGLSLFDREKEWDKLEQLLAEGLDGADNQGELVELVEKTWLEVQGKRDSFCAYIAQLEYQVKLADGESKRIDDRRKRIVSAIERLEDLGVATIKAIPKDDKGRFRKLEGATSSLNLAKNPPSVNITDDTLVPIEYKDRTIMFRGPASVDIPASVLLEMTQAGYVVPVDATIRIRMAELAKALKKWGLCPTCRGAIGVQSECKTCNGKGEVHPTISGAQLIEDSVRLVRK